MKTKDVQIAIGRLALENGHVPVIQNVKYLIASWELDVVSFTERGFMYEYEVKVSRSDFLADAKKKVRKFQLYEARHSKNWLMIPNFFSYCCPENLIQKDEIPEYAGLYWVTAEGRVIEKKRPKRLHGNVRDLLKTYRKCMRVRSERDFFGCSMMTFKNRELKKRYG